MTGQYLKDVGTFDATVDALPEGGSYFHVAETGTDGIRIPLVVDTPGGERITDWVGWFSEAAFTRTIQTLKKVFGFNGDLVALQAGKISFEGMPCQIVTENEEYKGKMRCKVKWLNPVGGGRAAAPEAAKVDAIVKRLQRKAMAIAKETPGDDGAGQDPFKETRAGTTAEVAAHAASRKPEAADDIPM